MISKIHHWIVPVVINFSMLTIVAFFVPDTLSLQNYIVLIACVSPLDSDKTTTVSSLQFATRVGKIKCNPEAGRVIKQVNLASFLLLFFQKYFF